jgi:hypothetical protein
VSWRHAVDVASEERLIDREEVLIIMFLLTDVRTELRELRVILGGEDEEEEADT